MIVPHGDAEYYSLRRNIAVPQPGKNNGTIDLDGHFGLHPSMTALETFWKEKKFAVVEAAGSPDNTRSHFDARLHGVGDYRNKINTRWLARSCPSNLARQGSHHRSERSR